MLYVMEHSISNGFESFTVNEQWDPVLEQQITRKMPQGMEDLRQNWITFRQK